MEETEGSGRGGERRKKNQHLAPLTTCGVACQSQRACTAVRDCRSFKVANDFKPRFEWIEGRLGGCWPEHAEMREIEPD